MWIRTRILAIAILGLMPPSAWPISPIHQWSRSFGDSDPQYSESVAIDEHGNVVVAGQFWGSVNFGGTTLTSAGDFDVFIAKFDAYGFHLWSKRFGDEVYQYARDAAIDGEGNVLLTGEFNGTIDFGGGPLVASGEWSAPDIFVVKLTPGGAHIWSKRFGDEYQQRGWAVTADHWGNVSITGDFNGSVNFGGVTHTASEFWQDAFLAKFDSDGGYLWSRRFGDEENGQHGLDAVVDDGDNVLLTGEFFGNINLGGNTLVSPSGYISAFLAKFDPSGSHVWSKLIDRVNAHDYGIGVAVDATGNPYLTGYTLGPPYQEPYFYRELYLMKFASDGDSLWTQRFGGQDNRESRGLTVDVDGNVTFTGAFGTASELTGTTVDFGGGPLLSAGKLDIFIAKFDANGTHVWSTRFGDANQQYGESVGADGSGNVVLTGVFDGALNLGGGAFPYGQTDIFVAKFGNNCYELFPPRLSSPAENVAPGTPIFYDSVQVLLTRAPGDSFYVVGSCAGPDSWIVDDKLFIDGVDAGLGFNGDRGYGLPVGVPMDSILNPVPKRNVTALIPWGTNVVTFKLADTERAIYGNTSIYLLRIEPQSLTGVRDEPRGGSGLAVYSYPNPFNPITTIRYTTASAGSVSIGVYDARGRRIRNLVDTSKPAGEHAVTWDGRDSHGRAAASGVYFVRLEVGGNVQTSKITLLR